MRQIGRKVPSDRPKGDYEAKCDYCGSVWWRSKLRRDGAGLLMCPDDDGLDAVTLDRMNQEMGPHFLTFHQDAASETKVVEIGPYLPDLIGGTTFAFLLALWGLTRGGL